MREVNKQQMDHFLKKMKKEAIRAVAGEEQAKVYGFWMGFINAMKMTGVISKEEYDYYYNEALCFCKKFVA